MDPWNEICYIRSTQIQLDCTGFRYFSILPIDPVLEGVSILGAKYPLDCVTVQRGDSLTVSNEPIGGEQVTIQIEKGSAWLVLSERLR